MKATDLEKYDSAIFEQALRRAARNKEVTRGDIEAAFWAAARDLELAILQQRPDAFEEARDEFREACLPDFVRLVEKDFGLTVIG